MDFSCPKCKADTRPDWLTPSREEMEGREWRCSTCRTTLLLLLGQVTVVHIPPGSGGTALPPGAPRR